MTVAVRHAIESAELALADFWAWLRPSYRDVRVDGVAARYSCCGSGPPLLLLASPGEGARSYVSAVRALCRSFTVVCLELPPCEWTEDRHAAWTLQLVRHLPLAAPIVVGHAGSVSIAARMAALAPDEIGEVVLVEGSDTRGFEKIARAWIDRLRTTLRAARERPVLAR